MRDVRAVIDTNLIVSGLLWTGTPSRLLRAVSEGRIELVLSPELYLELEDVLNREKFSSQLEKRGLSTSALLASIRGVVEMVFPERLSLPNSLRDPDDLMVLECAVTGHVDLIITGDDDLLSMGTFQNTAIATAQAAMEMLEGARE